MLLGVPFDIDFFYSGAKIEIIWKNNKKTGHGRCVLKDCGAFQCCFEDDNIETGPKFARVNIGK